ncbi:MAG TPA: hypothetical protein VE487_05250 [Ilumatobacter sp.]|jgi:hypothetical protein|nr:hypothetical protein [Ilumatobacter sp.]
MSDHLGIVELSGVCAAMRGRSLELFELLGASVSSTSPGELQRLFAEACHRHAWHAELWEARAPAIPAAATSSGEGERLGRDPQPMSDGDEARRDRYRGELSAMEEALRALRARTEPALDPNTARTIDLVGRDVVEIAARLDALRSR